MKVGKGFEMKIIDKFRKQHPLIQALDIIFILLIIYEIITMKIHSITLIIACLIVIIPLFQGFFKKED